MPQEQPKGLPGLLGGLQAGFMSPLFQMGLGTYNAGAEGKNWAGGLLAGSQGYQQQRGQQLQNRQHELAVQQAEQARNYVGNLDPNDPMFKGLPPGLVAMAQGMGDPSLLTKAYASKMDLDQQERMARMQGLGHGVRAEGLLQAGREGRDRRERNANNDNASSDSAPTTAPADGSVNEEAPVATRSYFDRSNNNGNGSNTSTAEAAPAAQAAPATPVAEPVKAPASQSTAPASTPAPTAQTASAQGMPKVQSYALPMDALIQVAESSGLQWVNSDPAKIVQVQAAIAAEPKPVHVPRERPPVVVLDEGPLVLVETRKDLSEMKLPF